MHIYFLVSFAINSLWGDHFEPCHWRNITTSPGPGSMDCLISTSLLRYYIYIYIYIGEREREIYIYRIYRIYRICVAARVFVWNEEITFWIFWGDFPAMAMASWLSARGYRCCFARSYSCSRVKTSLITGRGPKTRSEAEEERLYLAGGCHSRWRGYGVKTVVR